MDVSQPAEQLHARGSGAVRSLSRTLGPGKRSPGPLAPAGKLTKSWAVVDHVFSSGLVSYTRGTVQPNNHSLFLVHLFN